MGVSAVICIYDRLFNVPNPLSDKSRNFLEFLNPNALTVISNAVVEPSVAEGEAGDFYQFERTGYFIHDSQDSKPGAPVLNRAVTLRDSWARIEKQLGLSS